MNLPHIDVHYDDRIGRAPDVADDAELSSCCPASISSVMNVSMKEIGFSDDSGRRTAGVVPTFHS